MRTMWTGIVVVLVAAAVVPTAYAEDGQPGGWGRQQFGQPGPFGPERPPFEDFTPQQRLRIREFVQDRLQQGPQARPGAGRQLFEEFTPEQRVRIREFVRNRLHQGPMFGGPEGLNPQARVQLRQHLRNRQPAEGPQAFADKGFGGRGRGQGRMMQAPFAGQGQNGRGMQGRGMQGTGRGLRGPAMQGRGQGRGVCPMCGCAMMGPQQRMGQRGQEPQAFAGRGQGRGAEGRPGMQARPFGREGMPGRGQGQGWQCPQAAPEGPSVPEAFGGPRPGPMRDAPLGPQDDQVGRPQQRMRRGQAEREEDREPATQEPRGEDRPRRRGNAL